MAWLGVTREHRRMPAKIAGRLRVVRPPRPLHPLSPVTDASPLAVRAGRPTWLDRRLWGGLALVVVCLVVGSRVMAAADDTVEVWAVSSDQGAGAVLTPGDLTLHRIHADATDLAPYFAAGALPDRLVLRSPIGAGELLPRDAVADAPSSGLVQLPIAVDPVQVPPSVGVGSTVDVYVVIPGVDAAGPLQPAIADADVVAAPSVDSTFGASGQRQVTLAVPEKEARAFYALLASADAPLVSIVGRP